MLPELRRFEGVYKESVSLLPWLRGVARGAQGCQKEARGGSGLFCRERAGCPDAGERLPVARPMSARRRGVVMCRRGRACEVHSALKWVSEMNNVAGFEARRGEACTRSEDDSFGTSYGMLDGFYARVSQTEIAQSRR